MKNYWPSYAMIEFYISCGGACSGSEHFQAKQYETCIRLFETSMLYLPRDPDSNLQRAKSLRVLCLCRLALMQYDRADEYVTEAEKVFESSTSHRHSKFRTP